MSSMINKNIELIKNTIIIFVGKFGTRLISFLLLPLYTAYLTTSDYGIVDLIITYVSLLVPVITIQLEMAAFRFLVENRNNNEMISKILTNILYCIFSFTVLFVIGYIILINFIEIAYKWYILLNVLVTIFSNLMLQISRGFGDNKTYSVGCVLAGTITILSNIVLIVYINMGAAGMLISTILANFITFIYIFKKLNIYKYINSKLFDKNFVKNALKYSWPLVPNSICWWIIEASDRTIITYFLGSSANGIYAISNKFSGIMVNISSIFNLAWTESASLHINDKDRDEFFSNTVNTVTKIITSIVLIVIAAMPFVFDILINEQYREAYFYIPILMIGTIFHSIITLYSGIYIAKKLTKKVTTTSMISAVLNIVINLGLINFIGVYAAAISTMLSYMIMAIFRHIDLKKYVNIKYDKGFIIKNITMLLFVIIIYYINNIYLSIIGIIIVVLYIFLFNRDIIKSAVNMIHKKMNSKA